LSPVEFGQERFAPSREGPHLKIEILGTRFWGLDSKSGQPCLRLESWRPEPSARKAV